MTFSPLDSELLGPLFVTDPMRDVLSDRARLQAMLRTEEALAKASAHFGFAPPELGPAIAAIEADSLDFAALGRETATSGVLVIPFLQAVQKLLSPALAPALHEGATTQDIVDTALVLQIRDALDLVASDLLVLIRDLSVLAEKHRATPCVGRTYGQHAAPITFGFKVAVWLAGVTEVADRLALVRSRVLVASLGGPVGTLAFFGDKCANVLQTYAADLGLAAAPISWHTNRARMAETGAWLAELLGALAKVATDVVLLGSTDIAEIAEPPAQGRGGSSSMPHKKNPVSATVILAAHAASRGHLSTLFDAMAPAHERPAGLWHAEWLALPPLFGLVSGALREARALAAGLVVHEARMKATLDGAITALGPSFDPAATLVSAAIWIDRALADAARVRSSLSSSSPVAKD